MQPTSQVYSVRPALWRGAAGLFGFVAVYALVQLVLEHPPQEGCYSIFGYQLYTAVLYRVLVQMCVFIIAAVSMNLINGITGQFSLGHAGFMAVGGYLAAACSSLLHWPFAVALLVGGIAAALLGLLVGLPTLRLRGDYLAIATIGMGEIVRVLFENIQAFGGAGGFSGIMPPAPLLHLGSDEYALWGWAVLCMALTLLLITNFVRSSHGRACIAIREDELAAETMGINTTFFKVLAFCVGAAFAGIAGGLLAHLNYTITPDSAGFLMSVQILVMVVLGGLGSIAGSVMAAILLTLVNNQTADMSTWRMVIYAVLLVVLMIFRPQGLLGRGLHLSRWLKRRERADVA